MQINCYVFNLLRKRRGCRDIYDKIVPVNEIIIPKNWINEIGEISEDEWKKYSKNLNQRTSGPVNAHLISWPNKAQNIKKTWKAFIKNLVQISKVVPEV